MKTKLNPQVFREAAERVADDRNRYCCDALTSCQGLSDYSEETPYHTLFSQSFEPEEKFDEYGWWERGEHEARIIALLLCAEMCKR